MIQLPDVNIWAEEEIFLSEKWIPVQLAAMEIGHRVIEQRHVLHVAHASRPTEVANGQLVHLEELLRPDLVLEHLAGRLVGCVLQLIEADAGPAEQSDLHENHDGIYDNGPSADLDRAQQPSSHHQRKEQGKEPNYQLEGIEDPNEDRLLGLPLYAGGHGDGFDHGHGWQRWRKWSVWEEKRTVMGIGLSDMVPPPADCWRVSGASCGQMGLLTGWKKLGDGMEKEGRNCV